MESIPPQVQNQIRQFQQTRESLATVQSQKMQFESQVRELERTIKVLGGTADDDDVYRSVGTLLIRVKDRSGLESDLADQKETLDVRLKALERQRASLEDRLQELQGHIEKALGGPQ